MAKMINTIQEMAQHIFAVYDNGGATQDRYTICFSDLSCLGVCGSPGGPLGFSQHSDCSVEYVYEGGDEDKPILFTELPEVIQGHVMRRTNEGYADYLDGAVSDSDLENMRQEIMSEWQDARADHAEHLPEVM